MQDPNKKISYIKKIISIAIIILCSKYTLAQKTVNLEQDSLPYNFSIIQDPSGLLVKIKMKSGLLLCDSFNSILPVNHIKMEGIEIIQPQQTISIRRLDSVLGHFARIEIKQSNKTLNYKEIGILDSFKLKGTLIQARSGQIGIQNTNYTFPVHINNLSNTKATQYSIFYDYPLNNGEIGFSLEYINLHITIEKKNGRYKAQYTLISSLMNDVILAKGKFRWKCQKESKQK